MHSVEEKDRKIPSLNGTLLLRALISDGDPNFKYIEQNHC